MNWLGHLPCPCDAGARDGFARLRGYPPYEAPHAGPPAALTLAQAEDNLEHLRLHRAQRLVLLGAWLDSEGIDIRPGLSGGDPTGLLDALHGWAHVCWPAWHDPAIAQREVWLRSRRTGPEIVYSLLFDVALLMGELISQRHGGYRWALALDEGTGGDDRRGCRRPVLLWPAQGMLPSPVQLDLEGIVVSRYLRRQRASDRFSNAWAEMVTRAVASGRETVRAKGPRSC